MYIPLPEQVWGILLFVFGNVILNWCIKIERDEFSKLKHLKILSRDGISQTNAVTSGSKIKKVVMTLVGFLSALGGIFLFFKSFVYL